MNCVQISHFEVSATFPSCFWQSEIVSSSSHTVKSLDVFLCLRILRFQMKFLVILQTSYISQVYVDRNLFHCGNSQELHWAKSISPKHIEGIVPFKTYYSMSLFLLLKKESHPAAIILPFSRKILVLPFFFLSKVLKDRINCNIALLS